MLKHTSTLNSAVPLLTCVSKNKKIHVPKTNLVAQVEAAPYVHQQNGFCEVLYSEERS